MMIEKFPALLQIPNQHDLHQVPFYLEYKFRCRAAIISKCIELYPEALDDEAIEMVFDKVHAKTFCEHTSVLSLVSTHRPMSLYEVRTDPNQRHDIRADPTYRRRILHLMPRHVFTPAHDADVRDLNWQPRAAMMMLLSQMKIQYSRQHHRIPV
jgi:hypothetical protein